MFDCVCMGVRVCIACNIIKLLTEVDLELAGWQACSLARSDRRIGSWAV